MKTLALGAVAAGAWLVFATQPAPTPSTLQHETGAVRVAVAAPHKTSPTAAHATTDLSPATLTQVVQQYCVVCHNDALLTGNVSFQTLDVDKASERAETAERMIRKLRAGMMPPPGIPRPGGDTLLQLVQTLETNIDNAARTNPNLGQRRFQRLTRAEYNLVIKDLLDLEVDSKAWLPPDVIVGTFDNASTGQMLTTTLLDAFMRASSEVSRLAIGNPTAASVSMRHQVPAEESQHPWDHIEGTPFGTRGGFVVTQNFPVDGDYTFLMETNFGDKQVDEDVDISIDGERVALISIEHAGGDQVPVKRTDPIFVTSGQHQVSAAFVNKMEGMYEDRFSPAKWSASGNQAGQAGITGLSHLTYLTITGPTNPKGISESVTRSKIFTCRPTAAAQQRACAQTILGELATNAYRRPVTETDVADLMKFYDESAAKDGFDIGVRTGLQAILSSPEFIFRFEREPEGIAPGKMYRLNDVDLATRLSFFLWASGPDEELLKIAKDGKLSNACTLEQQVRRMLEDPKAEALSTRFLHQWLRLQDVGKVWPESYLFPDFSEQLAKGLVTETEMLFQNMIKEDRSILDLFNADYTYVNERLAQHYGIDGVYGEEFRKVTYPNTQRRGIFGHGSVLQLTSMSDRTSPVLRGKWVMEVMMGTPPPPPPPNVPAFEASPDAAGGRRLTTRERMEVHRKSPVCNSCHRFIDPIGLALDNFDPTGKYRIRENMEPLDTRGEFYDGTPVSNSSELATTLLKRPIPLVRNFTDRLLSYAVGRPVEYYDFPTIRSITKAAEPNGYKVTDLILGVVKSDAFQMRQAQTTAN